MGIFTRKCRATATSGSQSCRYTYTDRFSFAPIPVGFIFPPHSVELREKFNKVVEELIQSGLMDKEFATAEEEVGKKPELFSDSSWLIDSDDRLLLSASAG